MSAGTQSARRALTPARVLRGRACLALALALAFCALVCPWPGRAGDLSGRYVAATSPLAGLAPASMADGGTVDLAARRHGYVVTWHPPDGGRRRRGLGLRDGDDWFGVSIATGGAAFGVQAYHLMPGGHTWHANWISSIDGAASLGEISFDSAGPLPGRHPMTCQRPGAGSFAGAVDISARGDDLYALTFYLGHAVLYRGVGLLLAPDRLVVGWSFGSPPAVACYRIGADGLFTGRRVGPHSDPPAGIVERLAREGADAARLLPALAKGSTAAGAPADSAPGLPRPAFGALSDAEGSLLAMMEPGAPSVKAWNYDELQRRYGSDGWADRWLAEQLTPEEYSLLRTAVRRQTRARARANGPAAAGGAATVGELIAAARQRAAAQDDDAF